MGDDSRPGKMLRKMADVAEPPHRLPRTLDDAPRMTRARPLLPLTCSCARLVGPEPVSRWSEGSTHGN
nr:MAG TPA: hypothetical protein [Caudoviricetes sp.]